VSIIVVNIVLVIGGAGMLSAPTIVVKIVSAFGGAGILSVTVIEVIAVIGGG
jgi:hypothetical protein